MVRRRAGDAFGDSYTFPGGVVDNDESGAQSFCRGIAAEEANALLKVPEGGLDYYSAAIRELFEETNLLLARDAGGAWAIDGPGLQELRAQVNKGIIHWSDFLREQELTMACDGLHYFAHWETPINQPKRWSARFFFAEMPPEQDVRFDGSELTDSRWLSADEALSCGQDGGMKLPFPTVRTLKTMCKFNSIDELLDWARERAVKGVEKIRPVPVKVDGKSKWAIPGDPDYPDNGDS